MSTTLDDLVETAIMLDYNEWDVVGPCAGILNTQKKPPKTEISGIPSDSVLPVKTVGNPGP